jgi:hypothetical protein
MIRRLAKALAPTSEEIRRLARRETDPREVGRFQPITRGPVVAVLVLAAVGVAAIVVAPFRLLAAAVGRPRADGPGADGPVSTPTYAAPPAGPDAGAAP